MADFNSSLPIRTETNGDVVSKLCDGTTVSQTLGIDASGRITNVISDPTTPANKLGIDANGRPAITISDPTTPAQKAVVDANGSLQVKQRSGDVWTVQIGSGVVTGEVHDYNTAAAVAAAATSNHDYTVTVAKTLILKQILVSASGKFKAELQVPSGTPKAVFFGTGAGGSYVDCEFAQPFEVAAAAVVRIIRTNRDNQAQDLYSTIIGHEV